MKKGSKRKHSPQSLGGKKIKEEEGPFLRWGKPCATFPKGGKGNGLWKGTEKGRARWEEGGCPEKRPQVLGGKSRTKRVELRGVDMVKGT